MRKRFTESRTYEQAQAYCGKENRRCNRDI